MFFSNHFKPMFEHHRLIERVEQKISYGLGDRCAQHPAKGLERIGVGHLHIFFK